jgi:micrococcal nuclease
MRAGVLLLVALLGCSNGRDEAAETASTKAAEQQAPDPTLVERTCVRVVDGDTIELDGGEKVRYIGIDTPETVHPREPVQWMGKEATQANRVLVEGRKVGLEYDVERRDKYGRTLAYVWAGDVLVNERLVQLGYAQVSTYPPNVRYVERFLAAQRQAREAGRGLWGKRRAVEPPSSLTPDDTTVVFVTRTGKKYHRAGCQYLRLSQIPCTKQEAIRRGYTACSRCGP